MANTEPAPAPAPAPAQKSRRPERTCNMRSPPPSWLASSTSMSTSKPTLIAFGITLHNTVGYNIPVAIFGGFALFVATWLIQLIGNPLPPAFRVIAASPATLVAMTWVKETAFEPRRDGRRSYEAPHPQQPEPALGAIQNFENTWTGPCAVTTVGGPHAAAAQSPAQKPVQQENINDALQSVLPRGFVGRTPDINWTASTKDHTAAATRQRRDPFDKHDQHRRSGAARKRLLGDHAAFGRGLDGGTRSGIAAGAR